MRHWYLLAKELRRPISRVASSFVDGGGPNLLQVTPPGVRLRLFVLGAVEVLPLGGCLGFGSYLEPMVPYLGTAATGVVLSVLLCWLLRHQTPLTVIHAVPSTAANAATRHDGKIFTPKDH
jgi:hypothetical protein